MLEGAVHGCAVFVARHEFAHLLWAEVVDHHTDEGFGLSVEEDYVVGAAWKGAHARYWEEAVVAYCALEGGVV